MSEVQQTTFDVDALVQTLSQAIAIIVNDVVEDRALYGIPPTIHSADAALNVLRMLSDLCTASFSGSMKANGATDAVVAATRAHMLERTAEAFDRGLASTDARTLEQVLNSIHRPNPKDN